MNTRQCCAVSDVLSNMDLISLVLRSIDPRTYVHARRVCKAWLDVCRSDEAVLRGVSQYHGKMTKSRVIDLWALSSQQADSLPRTIHPRYRGGIFFLYDDAAVDLMLANGGMAGLACRLRDRARTKTCEKWLHTQTSHDRKESNRRKRAVAEAYKYLANPPQKPRRSICV